MKKEGRKGEAKREEFKKGEIKKKTENLKEKNQKDDKNQQQEEEIKTEKLPRNVNYYQHLVGGSMTTEASLAWVLDLRAKQIGRKTYRSPSGPPGCYNKWTESMPETAREGTTKKLWKTTVDVEQMGNSNEIIHLTHHRIGQVANKSQVTFETGLRKYINEQPRQAWSSAVKVDRGEFPTFLPPLRDIHTANKQNPIELVKTGRVKMETAFVGDHKSLPKYDDKKSNKQTSVYKHLFGSDKSISNLNNWYSKLRT